MPVRDEALALRGFTELQRALTRLQSKSDFGLEYELQRRLKKIGEGVAEAAPKFVTHKTGRHANPAEPRLEDSVRVKATTSSVSVYSVAEYGGVQNVGGGPHAGWGARGPHVRKDQASRWMIRAVQEQRENVKAEADELLEWVVLELERG